MGMVDPALDSVVVVEAAMVVAVEEARAMGSGSVVADLVAPMAVAAVAVAAGPRRVATVVKAVACAAAARPMQLTTAVEHWAAP